MKGSTSGRTPPVEGSNTPLLGRGAGGISGGEALEQRQGGADKGESSRSRSVLIIDDQEPFVVELARSFRERGFAVWADCDFVSAATVIEVSKPGMVVCEQTIAGRSVFDQLSVLMPPVSGCALAIVTSHPSIAAATRAVRMGAAAYLAKPAPASAILAAIELTDLPAPTAEPAASWPSLDRTIWEYLNSVFLHAGSMSEAARRLKIDRRSLRRMLAKNPPVV